MIFPTFGKLREQDAPRFHSWVESFDDYARRYLAAAGQHNLLDGVDGARLEGALDRSRALLARVARGVLVHSGLPR